MSGIDWNQAVDAYCERLDAGVFAEPFNAASNLAFIAAGLWLYARYRSRAPGSSPGSSPRVLRVLALMIVLIGLGSGAFHLWARRWGELLDVAAIALFIHFYVACWLRHALRWHWGFAALGVVGFVLFSMALTAVFDAGAFNGSVGYFPALAALLLMGLILLARGASAAVWFFAAAAVFLASLGLRSYDLAWCAQWPLGTHWLWHVLNALTLSLALQGLDRSAARWPDER